MGRGRAKAKQTKVARQLKYHTPNTDFAALERELGGGGNSDGEHPDGHPDERPDGHSDATVQDDAWMADETDDGRRAAQGR